MGARMKGQGGLSTHHLTDIARCHLGIDGYKEASFALLDTSHRAGAW